MFLVVWVSLIVSFLPLIRSLELFPVLFVMLASRVHEVDPIERCQWLCGPSREVGGR